MIYDLDAIPAPTVEEIVQHFNRCGQHRCIGYRVQHIPSVRQGQLPKYGDTYLTEIPLLVRVPVEEATREYVEEALTLAERGFVRDNNGKVLHIRDGWDVQLHEGQYVFHAYAATV